MEVNAPHPQTNTVHTNIHRKVHLLSVKKWVKRWMLCAIHMLNAGESDRDTLNERVSAHAELSEITYSTRKSRIG